MKQNSRIIVKNLPKHLTESALKAHFSGLGRVTDCRIIFKGNTNRRFAFLGFRDPQSAADAVKKFDQTFIGTQKILVRFALVKGDKNLKSRKKQNQQKTPNNNVITPVHGDTLKNRFFVKNFPFTITQEELREVFEVYGELTECRIIRNSEQQSRGFGFVTFADSLDAAKAYDSVHNSSSSQPPITPRRLRQDHQNGLRVRAHPQQVPDRRPPQEQNQ